MPFDKIKKSRVVDSVCDSLKKKILDQTFQVGDKLPSESALSEQFGISKTSVKIALQRLSTLGLIETRVGHGSYVREFDPNIYLAQIHSFLLDTSDIDEITEYRIFMEMSAFRLAMHNADPENFEKMENVITEMENDIEDPSLTRHDYQFHLELFKATKNRIFVLTYEVIGKMIRQHAEISRKKFHTEISFFTKDGLNVHRRLLDALKKKDIEAARQCYLEMFAKIPLPEKSILNDA